MNLHVPTVGQTVHYVSYGTPGGEYSSRCRAAIVTEVGQWITTDETGDQPDGAGNPVRHLEQTFYRDAAALAVLNPTGMFFNGAGQVACRRDELPPAGKVVAGERSEHKPGTWHDLWGCSR